LRKLLESQIRPGDWIVLAGSVPPPLPATVYADLTALAHGYGAKVALDTDGRPLVEGVKAFPDLIKPNCEELERLIGRSLPTDADVVRAAFEIENASVPIVVVSMGRRGAIGVSASGLCRVIPPRVTSVSAIGAGDSLVAGLVLGLSRGQSLEASLRLGTAAGAATALHPGTRLGTREDVERLLPFVAVQPLQTARAA
jgi:1-phosphofructokinase family hexose kinase